MKETKVYLDELPESCAYCPCCSCDLKPEFIKIGDIMYCNLLKQKFRFKEERKKLKDCPLQSLKTHDRELFNENRKKIKEIAHLKEKDNYHLRYELAGADETIANLRQQLAEKQNTIDEINKEFVQSIHDWKALCAEKDKEISKLQASCQQVKTQLAIQELEKVKEDCFNQKELVDFGYVACFMVDIADILEIIDNQIKELKGEL